MPSPAAPPWSQRKNRCANYGPILSSRGLLPRVPFDRAGLREIPRERLFHFVDELAVEDDGIDLVVHVFEIHLLTRIAGIDLLDALHPVEGYRPGSAATLLPDLRCYDC